MASRPALSAPLTGIALLATLLAAATAQAAFPYVAYVTADTVVRSGPGTTYYPTAKAPRGVGRRGLPPRRRRLVRHPPPEAELQPGPRPAGSAASATTSPRSPPTGPWCAWPVR